MIKCVSKSFAEDVFALMTTPCRERYEERSKTLNIDFSKGFFYEFAVQKDNIVPDDMINLRNFDAYIDGKKICDKESMNQTFLNYDDTKMYCKIRFHEREVPKPLEIDKNAPLVSVWAFNNA